MRSVITRQGTCGNTLTRKADIASSMPTPSNKSAASATTKLCSSNAMRSTSSFTRGHHLDREASTSLLWKEEGVEGQSVMGALDQLVTAVVGEIVVTGSRVAGSTGASATGSAIATTMLESLP